jgi:hypothetical protein
VGELENGWHDELQEDEVVLVEVRVERGRLWRRLPMARPNGGVMADGGEAREKEAGVELGSRKW